MVDKKIKDELARLGFETTGETVETVSFKNKRGSQFALSQYKGEVSMTGTAADTDYSVGMDITNSFTKDESLDDVGRAIMFLSTLTDW